MAAPTLTSVAGWDGSATGPETGDTWVELNGSGFQPGAAVRFGGAVTTEIVLHGHTTIWAFTPPHAPGVVAVTVTNPDGQRATLPAGFTYRDSTPTVTSLGPPAGRLTGGSWVELRGANLGWETAVQFGGEPAAAVRSWGDPTSLWVETPAHALGVVDVVVTNPDGRSATLAAAFTFTDGPVLAMVLPPTGMVAGGEWVEIWGDNLTLSTIVRFGDVPAIGVSGWGYESWMMVQTPAHASGTVHVTITNPDGRSATLAGGYTFTEVGPQSLRPAATRPTPMARPRPTPAVGPRRAPQRPLWPVPPNARPPWSGGRPAPVPSPAPGPRPVATPTAPARRATPTASPTAPARRETPTVTPPRSATPTRTPTPARRP